MRATFYGKPERMYYTTTTVPSGHTPSHTDIVRPGFAPEDGEYTADPETEPHPAKEGYGTVSDRCPEIEVSHPAPDIETLQRLKHLTVAFHEHNKNEWEGEWEFPNDGSTLYDLAVLDIAEQVFEIEQFDPSEFDILPRRFLLLFLQQARAQDNRREFYRYIEDRKPVLITAGYDNPDALLSYAQLQRVADTLETELGQRQDALDRACCRAVYATYRNGIVPPAPVVQQYGFADVGLPLKEWRLPYTHKQTALRGWIRRLATETLGPLTLDRDRTQTDFELLDFLGLAASSAVIDGGLQNAARVSSWDHPWTNVPSGRGLPECISGLDITTNPGITPEVPTINQQFDAVHNNTLAFADDLGLIGDSHSLAVDLYRIEWTGRDTAPTINRIPKAENDVESEWIYVVIGIIDKEARLTLGTRWLPSKGAYPQKIREILPGPPAYFDVDGMYADAEMVSGRLIDALRSIAGSDWVIRTPTRGVMKKLQKATPLGYVGFAPGVSWNSSSDPNVVSYPRKASDPSVIQFDPENLKGDLSFPSKQVQTSIGEYSTEGVAASDRFEDTAKDGDDAELPRIVDEFETPASAPGFGNERTHVTSFTDRSLQNCSAEDIHFPYYERWALEQSINQISNHTMPVFEGSHPERRLYGVNLAILFYNWHTIINRAVSPKPWYRLDCTHQEVLKAIQHVAFSESSD